jgi:hypothetical protein
LFRHAPALAKCRREARTDANSMLSVSLVKKAQQIEKLAKQIKDLAKG